MEWIEGVKLTDRAAMEARRLDVVDFVSVGVECTLRQLLDHGYFHADPHPGNILGSFLVCPHPQEGFLHGLFLGGLDL